MRILVIEDDPHISALLKAGLESECFAVDTVRDGDEGLYLARTNSYDVIILDYVLPNRNGLSICSELRADGIQTAIIGLSVRSEVANKVEFLNAGADDYLTKPFSLEELLARIRALLRRPLEIQADILQVDNIELDCQKQVVRKDEKEIYLTRKEFMLLEYLMRNQGTVLSRAMILEHVWDMNADPFSNTIESHILSLRKKLRDKSHIKFIQTVPGRGYKIA